MAISVVWLVVRCFVYAVLMRLPLSIVVGLVMRPSVVNVTTVSISVTYTVAIAYTVAITFTVADSVAIAVAISVAMAFTVCISVIHAVVSREVRVFRLHVMNWLFVCVIVALVVHGHSV